VVLVGWSKFMIVFLWVDRIIGLVYFAFTFSSLGAEVSTPLNEKLANPALSIKSTRKVLVKNNSCQI
jgi:hypothetical protein